MLALRSTLEALVQAIPMEAVSKNEATSKMMQPLTVPYPFEAVMEQINTMLLRINQICCQTNN